MLKNHLPFRILFFGLIFLNFTQSYAILNIFTKNWLGYWGNELCLHCSTEIRDQWVTFTIFIMNFALYRLDYLFEFPEAVIVCI